MADEPRNKRQLLGGAVRRLREAKSKTQDQLATSAGIDFTYLSKLERSLHQPSIEVMCRIANALEVDLDDISYMATIYVVTEDAA